MTRCGGAVSGRSAAKKRKRRKKTSAAKATIGAYRRAGEWFEAWWTLRLFAANRSAVSRGNGHDITLGKRGAVPFVYPLHAMNAPDANLYLVGFMGTGKTTIGRSVSQRLGFNLLDSDHEIEAKYGKPISEIFAKDGEPVFRRYEREFIENGHPATGQVVACGGGLVVQPGMLELLQSKGVVICLHASLETILRRTAGHRHRPLLNVEDPEERIRTLYALREPIYRRSGTVILTDSRPMSDIVNHVLRVYRRETPAPRSAPA